MSEYFVYILKSINYAKTYVGITDNIHRRLIQHNNGYHPYTKRYAPWKIITIEKNKNRAEARAREKYLKSCTGRKWISNNLFNKPRW